MSYRSDIRFSERGQDIVQHIFRFYFKNNKFLKKMTFSQNFIFWKFGHSKFKMLKIWDSHLLKNWISPLAFVSHWNMFNTDWSTRNQTYLQFRSKTESDDVIHTSFSQKRVDIFFWNSHRAFLDQFGTGTASFSRTEPEI